MLIPSSRTWLPPFFRMSEVTRLTSGSAKITWSAVFFIISKKSWKEIGLSDEDLLAFQIMLLKNPESGPVMEGTGGNNMNSLFEDLCTGF